MSNLRPTTSQHLAILKSATRRAIRAAGGGESVQYSTRVKPPHLSRYSNPDKPGEAPYFIPVDVAADIDLEAGQPIILRALADIEGYTLRPVAAQARNDMPWCSEIANLVSETSDVVRTISEALADDNEISNGEAVCIVREIDEAKDLLDGLRARLVTPAGEGGQ